MVLDFILSSALLFAGIGTYLFIYGIPMEDIINKFVSFHKRRKQSFVAQLEELSYAPSYKLILVIMVFPLFFAGLVFLITHHLIFAGIASVLGFILPSFLISFLKKRRIDMFNDQLVDGLMEISNSLKGGLSLIPALEEVVQYSPSPLKDEFELLVRTHKMGVPLEECLQVMNRRIKSEYLKLMTSAILVGKEMGGNLIRVFIKLVVTIRERKKLEDKMKILTFQGRFQALIISLLPFIFIYSVYKMDTHHFDIMLNTETGKALLVIAGICQILALVLIKRFSTLKY